MAYQKFVPLVDQEGVLDIIGMADAHRRQLCMPTQDRVIAEIDKVMTRIGKNILLSGAEKRLTGMEMREESRLMVRDFNELREKASVLDNSVILLPFCENSARGREISSMLKDYNAAAGFAFRKEPYSRQFNETSKISLNIRNILQARRGEPSLLHIWDIDDKVRVRWSEEVWAETKSGAGQARFPRLV